MKCHGEGGKCLHKPACEHACNLRVQPVLKERMPCIGPGVATSYPRAAWSRLPSVNLEDVWKIVGGNVDMHMSRHPLWKVLCLVYLEGIAHGSQGERPHHTGDTVTPEDDVKALREALEAGPTDGPWIAAGPSLGNPRPIYHDSVVQDIEGDDNAPTICRDAEEADADYIAAASPDRIRRILDRMEAAEKAPTIGYSNGAGFMQPEVFEAWKAQRATPEEAALWRPVTWKA